MRLKTTVCTNSTRSYPIVCHPNANRKCLSEAFLRIYVRHFCTLILSVKPCGQAHSLTGNRLIFPLARWARYTTVPRWTCQTKEMTSSEQTSMARKLILFLIFSSLTPVCLERRQTPRSTTAPSTSLVPPRLSAPSRRTSRLSRRRCIRTYLSQLPSAFQLPESPWNSASPGMT